MDELYIYLGNQHDTFFFIHTITNDKFKEGTSWQIYNVMIDETMIDDPTKNVIIYEFNLEDQTVDAIIIQHATNKENLTFDKSNIESFFNALLHAERKKCFVISYNYKIGAFNTFDLETDDVFDLEINSFNNTIGINEKLEINEIKYIMCSKSLAQNHKRN